jgi:lysozyme
MRYLKYLKHWIAIHPVKSLIILLFLFLFLAILFYFRKEIKSKLSNYKLNLKLNRKIKYGLVLIILFTSIIITFFTLPKKKTNYTKLENTSISNSNHLFGIDISHHNGVINWDELTKSKHPIKYVFIKATEGEKLVDRRFHHNWEKATEKGYTKGAYHFYRPDINSATQFNHFSSTVKLNKGDLLPVLDVEKRSRLGRENLIKGIRNWVNLCEQKYGVKPIIYTGRKFYLEFLKNEFSDCSLWIASYSNENSIVNIDWDLHQFTEKVIIKGIPENVDGNNFKGDIHELKKDFCLN